MLDTPERVFVLKWWKERETDFQWMSELLKMRDSFDQNALSSNMCIYAKK